MLKSHRSQKIFHFGPQVDEYLRREGAIAQAIDPETILLSSAIMSLSPDEQRLIVLHEIAHLQQLAREGKDPTRALEDEAWEAANSWMQGKHYRIRGRGKSRLNAVAIIQGGTAGHPSAPPWYKSNPIEPIGNNSTIKVENVIVQEVMSFESIMDAIIDKKIKEVVIVCHGTSKGLFIPFVAGSKIFPEQDAIQRMTQDHTVAVGGINTPVVDDMNVAHWIKGDDMKKLREKMNKVHAVGLTHVAFRACDMGQSDTTLSTFRDFFGAKSVSAPKLSDSYGDFRPVLIKDIHKIHDLKHVKGLEGWAKFRRTRGFRVWIDNGVGFGINIQGLKYKIESVIPSNDAFTAWVRTHIGTGPDASNAVVYHAILDDPKMVADPNAPLLYFIKDDAFTANIVFSAG